MSTQLPPAPDFASLDVAAFTTADSRTEILALIGNLAFSWSNNESMFIYVIMLLLRCDEPAAAVIFSTLNTTRARIDLVQRLAALRLGNKKLADELAQLIERFNALTRLRNEFNHATFEIDQKGEIVRTHSLRIVERKGKIRFGESRKLDARRKQELARAAGELRDLNRAIWQFLPRLQTYMTGTPDSG